MSKQISKTFQWNFCSQRRVGESGEWLVVIQAFAPTISLTNPFLQLLIPLEFHIMFCAVGGLCRRARKPVYYLLLTLLRMPGASPRY